MNEMKGKFFMKKTILAATALSAALSFAAAALPAAAQIFHTSDPRRTLHAAVGQKSIVLEAPAGMCFLDRTGSATQRSSFAAIGGITEARGDQMVIGVFMPCELNPQEWLERMPDFGTVSWVSSLDKDKTKLTRTEYLDMRESYFVSYAQTAAGENYKPEGKKPHRDKDSVSLALSGEETTQAGGKQKVVAVYTTTTLRDVPIEISSYYGDEKLPPVDELYNRAGKLVAQQIALNAADK